MGFPPARHRHPRPVRRALLVGVYYVGQQVASLPQKLKTSFDPILAPVITQKLAEGDRQAVAKQVRQVGFWIIAAQAGIALALGIPGEAVMGLVGTHFVGGTGALAFLLAAEVVAATAAVSESALVYIARHRNLMISALMILVQATSLTVICILVSSNCRCGRRASGLSGGERRGRLDDRARPGFDPQGEIALPAARCTGPGLALAFGLCGRGGGDWSAFLHAPCPQSLEWVELAFGIPAILATSGWSSG